MQYTAAPGGQRVFVEGDGALSFTAAHTGGAIPNGGIGESFGVKGQLLRREFSFSERHDAPNISDPNAVFDDSPIFISPWLACPIGQQANSPGPGQIEPTTTTGSNDGPAKRATDEDCQPYEQCADGHFNQPDSVTQPPPGFVPPTGNGTADIGPYKIYATKISIEGVEDPPNPGCMKIGTNVRFIGSVNKPAPEPIEYFY